VRRECRDPGFYRWPPHANIVYPFLEPIYDESESKDDQRINFRNEIAMHLSKAAMQCEPFDVTLNSFGTFGGNQRGVLWAYPMSKYTQPRDNDDDEPLINLHGLLEQQFPICNEQRKSGAFHPHITLSHYATNADALAAKEKIESGWEPVSFRAHEIYLLERKGDDGQFKISATISLGADSEVNFHDPPIPFPAMPAMEEEWVHDERMAMKDRRKKGGKRRRRGGRGKELDDLQNGRKEES
jgi:2'-5' RNA ligase